MKLCSILCFNKIHIFRTASTEYGLRHAHIHDCGLVVSNAFPFIAASPDGKVCENGECGLLEIKCSFLARDMITS